MSGTTVNPGILREFSGTVEETAAVIRDSSLPADLLGIAACMAGSSAAYALTTLADAMHDPLKRTAEAYSAMSGAVHNAAGEFEATDDELAAAFNRIASAR
ncbi:hypothetical protein ACPXCG_09975 [Gordonia sp. DT218]|uniref:hypothetical protein n=1 Tax=unclassified Gordonia (in: high G+C Gram-positive bacteria) TaxID=2657482 RepID=UPI003CEC30A8